MTGHAGGCQCGRIRYRFACQPLTVYTCHCTDCQRQSSAAFGISAWFPRREFIAEGGELSFWTTRSDAGANKLCAFCADCGSRIYHALDHDSEILSVKGGSLDRMGELAPVAHIWMKSAQPWVAGLLSGQACYDTQPDDFGEIIDLYRHRHPSPES